jgi:hypothetical protein
MKTFEEDLNTAVITTKYVLEYKSPILFVFHFADGFWQFSGAETELLDEDYRLVSLDEIINMDNTILEIADLPYDGKANRKDKTSPWVIQ